MSTTRSSFRSAASADREARVLLSRFGRLLHGSGGTAGAEQREFSQQERTGCSKDSILLSSTYVDKRYKMEHAILDEVDFLRRFGSHTLLDGDTQSPVGRQGSTELLRGLVEQMKTVWVIENELYVLNHILMLRRQYGILDDVAIVFMTTFEFKYNASLQVVVSHQYRDPSKPEGKTVVRLSEELAKHLDAIVVHQPLLIARWPSLSDHMHYVPNWARGRLLKRAAALQLPTKGPPGAQASDQGRYVLMAGQQGRDFQTGIDACKSAGLRVRLVAPGKHVEESGVRCVESDGCALSKHLEYEQFMEAVDGAWVVVVPLVPGRRLGSGSRLVGEALSSGIPVIVSSRPHSGPVGAATGPPGAADDPWGGVVEHGRNGLLVEPGRVDELAAALSRLKTQNGLYERLRSGAQADAASLYSLEAIGERLQDVVCYGVEYRKAHPSPKKQAEIETGNAAFNKLIENPEFEDEYV